MGDPSRHDPRQDTAVQSAEPRAAIRNYFALLQAEMRSRATANGPPPPAHGATIPERNESAGRALTQRHISAILLEHGLPHARAHRPLGGYPPELREAVRGYLRNHPEIFAAMEADAFRPAPRTDFSSRDLRAVLVEPPSADALGRNSGSSADGDLLAGVDFLACEQRNRSLAQAGEAFVLEFERQRLRSHGLDKFADAIEYTAADYGDAVGYDIQSYALDGSMLLIRVKTTRYCRETPCYLSENELAVARVHGNRYWLYRVFDFADQPHIYLINGALEDRCHLRPTVYRAMPR